MDLDPTIRHVPDPDHPGWWTWDPPANARFALTVGRLIVRPDGPGRGLLRMFPDESHANIAGAVHGGAILTFIDMALFAGGRAAGARLLGAVTLDLDCRFLSPGRIGTALEAEVELLKETKRLAFMRGKVAQEGQVVADFSGTLSKGNPRP